MCMPLWCARDTFLFACIVTSEICGCKPDRLGRTVEQSTKHAHTHAFECECVNDNWADYLTKVLPKTILKCLAGMGHATVNWETEYDLGLDVSFIRFLSVLFCF